MPEDSSLDEFAGSDAAADSGDVAVDDSPAAESGGDDGGGDGSGDSDDEATSATATWTAGGADCERCGDRVERRWLDEGDRICPACKSW